MLTRLRMIDRRLFTILMIVFVNMVGASMAIPILPLYAKNEFGLRPEFITPLVSVFFLAQFLAGPYIGRLSDRTGRIPVLIISQIGTVISFIIIGMANTAGLLFFARILDGITGGNIVVAQAYVTDITPREQRTQALGYILAAFGLGFIVGPATGGILSAQFGPRVPFFVAAVAATLTVLLTHFTLTETLSPEQREANRKAKSGDFNLQLIFTNQPLLLVLFITFVAQVGHGLVISTFALYGEAVLFKGSTEDAAQLGVGILLAVVGVGQFLTQTILLPRIINRLSDARIMVIGTVLRGLSMFIFAVVTVPILGAIASAFFAVGTGLMLPPLQSLSTQVVADEYRGGVLGIFQSTQGLAVIVSTAIAGILFAHAPTTPYWIAGFMFILALMPALRLVWNQRFV